VDREAGNSGAEIGADLSIVMAVSSERVNAQLKDAIGWGD